jgi:hypothetical protein
MQADPTEDRVGRNVLNAHATPGEEMAGDLFGVASRRSLTDERLRGQLCNRKV